MVERKVVLSKLLPGDTFSVWKKKGRKAERKTYTVKERSNGAIIAVGPHGQTTFPSDRDVYVDIGRKPFDPYSVPDNEIGGHSTSSLDIAQDNPSDLYTIEQALSYLLSDGVEETNGSFRTLLKNGVILGYGEKRSQVSQSELDIYSDLVNMYQKPGKRSYTPEQLSCTTKIPLKQLNEILADIISHGSHDLYTINILGGKTRESVRPLFVMKAYREFLKIEMSKRRDVDLT